MAFQLAEVEFHSEKNNFVLLHCGNNSGFLDLVPTTLTLIFENGSVYVSGNAEKTVFKTSKKFYIKINGLFAAKLKLKPGDQVCWSFVDNVQKCKEISVEPLTVDDWEIIESNASKIEEQLLSQLRIAYKNLIFPVWIDSSLCVYLQIDSVKPIANCVSLAEGTVILVSPKLLPRYKSTDNGLIKSPVSASSTNFSKTPNKSLDLPLTSSNGRGNIAKTKNANSSPDSPKKSRSNSAADSNIPKIKEISTKKSDRSSSPSAASPVASLWSRIKGAFSPNVEDKFKEFQKSPRSAREADPYLPSIAEDFECNVFEPLLEELLDYFESACLDDNFCGHAILEGPALSGTTFTAEALRKRLYADFRTYSKLLDCKTLCGKSVVNVTKTLCQLFDDCVKHGPSLVVLDDLDQLCCSASATKQLTPGADIHFAQITKALIQILDRIWLDRQKILVLATCKSRQKLNDYLTTVRGKRYFTKCFSIPNLTAKNRETLLSELLVRRRSSITPFKTIIDKLVRATDGCVAGDLRRLADRVLRASFLRGDLVNDINEADIEQALRGFESINLHGARVNQEMDAEQNWSDVGGLRDVKKNIIRVLQWPAKYSFIFSSLNVRLARGILLYGPSGTGKTLLASVVAKECGLNFIIVKGAELLSKYIGASEQAVRDTFARARIAKPSLILFDEFEALAPRRGHDSTGVTDRVVNQLLTELDGVEALDGVFVLATTSRPDLIDPAFLRPGRIDKCLFCGMPTVDEREDILNRLSRRANVSADVDMRDLAHRTYRYSGADLKALLFNAQLAAVHDDLNRNAPRSKKRVDSSQLVTAYTGKVGQNSMEDLQAQDLIQLERKLFSNEEPSPRDKLALVRNGTNGEIAEKKGVLVFNVHFDKALAETKPSVTEAELNRLQNVYTKFTTSSKSHLPDIGLSSWDVGQRATLA